MRDERTLKVRWILAMALTAMLLGLAMGGGGAFEETMPPGVRRLLDAPGSEKLAVFRDLGYDYRLTDSSFDFREQAYFLLTPALLVQEAVSDNVVLTYPEE